MRRAGLRAVALSVLTACACALTGCAYQSSAAAEPGEDTSHLSGNAAHLAAPGAVGHSSSAATTPAPSATASAVGPQGTSPQDIAAEATDAVTAPTGAPGAGTEVTPSASATPAATGQGEEPEGSQQAGDAVQQGTAALKSTAAAAKYRYRGTPQSTLDCSTGGAATIKESSVTLALDPTCTTVVVDGDGVVLYGGDLDSLTVNGDRVAANVGTLGHLVITGDGGAIVYEGPKPSVLKNSGEGNVVAIG